MVAFDRASAKMDLLRRTYLRHYGVVDERGSIPSRLSTEAFGQHTRALRSALGLGIDDLARRVGLEPSQLIRIEAGEVELHRDLVVAIAFGLGMTPTTFLRLWEVGRLVVK